jgi:hypothetical protein
MQSPLTPNTEHPNLKLQAHSYPVRPAGYRHVMLAEAKKDESEMESLPRDLKPFTVREVSHLKLTSLRSPVIYVP